MSPPPVVTTESLHLTESAAWLLFCIRLGRIEGVKFIYTRHAQLRIRQRDVSTHQIESVITSPGQLMPSFRGRTVAQKLIGRKMLEVVYRKLNDHIVIITAYWLETGA